MQDAALFYRHRAFACFRRRRKYPFLSEHWRHEVEDARRFIRTCHSLLIAYSDDERRAFCEQLVHSTYGGYTLGPRTYRKPPITAEERERRREAWRQADADNRIEGIFPDAESKAICDAHIEGRIDTSAVIKWIRRLPRYAAVTW